MNLYIKKKKNFPNCTRNHIAIFEARNGLRTDIYIFDNYQREHCNINPFFLFLFFSFKYKHGTSKPGKMKSVLLNGGRSLGKEFIWYQG